MTLALLTSPAAVDAALEEWDALGGDQFLKKYGYGRARTYSLVRDGKVYDSKAIAGVAVGKEHPERGPLLSSDFSGGEATVKVKLESLGFKVIGGAPAARLSSEMALELLKLRLGSPSSPPTKYLAVWRLQDGRELALQLDQESARIWSEEQPPAIDGVQSTAYDPDKSRHSHLRANAPTLAEPNEAWLNVIATSDALETFLRWAEGEGREDSFASIMQRLLEQFGEARRGPFGESSALWSTMGEFKARLEALPALQSRPDIIVKWSLGKGVWAKVPWVALLNKNITTTTRAGIYGVFLVAEDLSRIYLGLIQGAASLVDEHGPSGAVTEMQSRSSHLRTKIPELEQAGFALDGGIDLRTEGWRSKNYEVATIAQKEFRADSLPSDAELADYIEALLAAYDRLAESQSADSARPAWFVGASWDGEDQTPRFLSEGIWENGYESGPTLDQVRQIEPGDRIAIKSAFTQKHGLPFPNPRLETASIMRIKATGTVIDNAGDGRRLTVEWDDAGEPRDWYFYTYRDTIWQVNPGNELADRLIAFAFEGVEQDYAWFLNEPYWRDKFKAQPAPKAKPYSLEDALVGLFMERPEFERILGIWEAKKNLILQGAPGVGKTFIARRLAYVLMKEKDQDRVAAVQFHQSYGYEDFIQGYRPTATGGFELKDGVFFRFCEKARADLDRRYVFIVDEINRGNLSKIFGELMLLIEHDKRSADWGARLAYAAESDPSFFVPPNVFILGMMNTADRSLSMVDYALRRRFSFVSLSPGFQNQRFAAHLGSSGVPQAVISRVVAKMAMLNAAIAEDKVNLGPGFQIGHSFFTPPTPFVFTDDWFGRVVETEIRPLLEEYWFDEPAKAAEWQAKLLAD